MVAKVITITSGKGGVGKTTATANLAAALATNGKKVVCIDADIGLRNLDVVLGLENRIVYDLVDVVEGRCRLRQAMIRDKRLPELFLIPAAQTRDKSAVTHSDMVRLCEELRPDFDYILVDSPAGIERGFRNAIAPADIVIVITNPEVSAVRDADRIIGMVEAEEKGPARLIINRIKPEMVPRGDMLATNDVLELLAIELIGIIPDDENVVMSTNRGMPISMDGKSKAGQAFRNIDRRINGEQVPFMDLEQRDGFFLERFGAASSSGFDPDVHLERIGLANQTTMLMSESLEIGEMFRVAMVDRWGEDALADHFRAFDTICSATQERQDAVVAMLKEQCLDLMVVVGGYNSSNTCNLANICAERVPTYHVAEPDCLVSERAIRHRAVTPPGSPRKAVAEITTAGWLPIDGPVTVGLTAGASTPNNIIGEVIERLERMTRK